MLKALELVGFKSFADKTRLEFSTGITVVVGPNGSGKSNVVDAIKWVLGEQSVKSLRGKEMADVIFNGSSTRRPVNTAEVTVTFDNSKRLLAIESPEVHITRRVYRSGEGEYLINRQPCRLKDIRELFAGTGMATEAYSVIEQGKVDVLLQSSPRDRRLIFEEAAGISRFKAKKIESLRRLERVEQNLLRLSDIVDEVDSRLRAVRLQANKARRYKEHADRLQALRTQIGLADWRALTAKLEGLETELAALRQENADSLAHVDSIESQIHTVESDMAEAEVAARASQRQFASNVEQIAAHASTVTHQLARCRDLEEEANRCRRQSASMSVRAGDAQQHLRQVTDNLAAAELQHREAAQRLAEEERGLTKITAQIDELRADNERHRSAYLEQARDASALSSQVRTLESQAETLTHQIARVSQRLDQLVAAQDGIVADAQQQQERLSEIEVACHQQHADLLNVESQLAESRDLAAAARQSLAKLHQRHSGATERASVLEELEKRLEGLSAGVRQVLSQVQASDSNSPFQQVHGLVADLLNVNFETAPLIDVALGDVAQCLVVTGGRELVAHLQQSGALAGRVGFVRLDALPAKTHLDQLDFHGQPGVLGRADEFVETAPEYAVLARRVLGKTWIVETLSDAVRLSEGAGRGLNFVTRTGDLVTAEGMLYVGPRHIATGLISRRSELRVLKQQLAEMGREIEKQERLSRDLDRQVADQQQQTQNLARQCRETTEALSRQQLAAQAASEKYTQWTAQFSAASSEQTDAQQRHRETKDALAAARQHSLMVESSLRELESRQKAGTQQLQELEQHRQRLLRETGAFKIEVVKSEQRLTHLQAQKSQLERDQQERGKVLADSRLQLAKCMDRLRMSERQILHAESQLAELYLHKEQFALEVARRAGQHQAWLDQRTLWAAEAQRTRAKIRKLEAKLHAKDLAAGEVRHERTTLADRLREDYNIVLSELEHEPSSDELLERAAIEEEIADLRSKINSIGGVNLDALAELEELETRFQHLSSQHQDLASAKASLEQIINKINADSRRLFAETLEVVREHFQGLFRKLFGGGQADIVLDEGTDILDSGIEIVARPPGKEPRNISLLSGGEKTLTCVALLLAIFRSRPSPFCVLDEVDAALDEANIERFVGTLQEFLTWTQFIVVTHSKKTMTCASTLYGITMQESGVSKRVSVRFEDVSDNGEILNVRESDDEAKDDETQAA